MFYQCPNCQKVWQYPIKKCPDCFLELKRITTSKVKVIGVSKVAIPTLLHPKIPYFVLVLEDENGNRWAYKTFKEYKIGDEFKTEASQDKNAVAIWRVKYDALEAIEKVVDLIGGITVDQNSKILILPTLLSPKHPYFAENTNPRILEGLIKFLIQKGVKVENIKVAAQNFNEIPIEVAAQKSGLLEICIKTKIIPLDMTKTNFVKKTEGDLVFEISEEVFKQDLVINLPALKLDWKLGIKGARENSLKFLKKESYFSLKYLYDQKELMEKIQKVLPNYLTIADGTVIQKQDKYTSFLGIILASFNPWGLDRIFAEIVIPDSLPSYLQSELDNIPIVGREIKEIQCQL